MSARPTSRPVWVALGAVALLAGCAADPRVRVKWLEQEQRDLNMALQAADQSVLEVQLTLDGNFLRAKAEATSARLVSKRDGTAEGMLRDEMNKRALRTPLNFDLTIAGSSAVPRRLMVTGNHVVVTYAP
jgi:hypothetical protein